MAGLLGLTGPLRSRGAGGAPSEPGPAKASASGAEFHGPRSRPLAGPRARARPAERPASGRPVHAAPKPPPTPSPWPRRAGGGVASRTCQPILEGHRPGRVRFAGPGPFWRRAGMPFEPHPSRSPARLPRLSRSRSRPEEQIRRAVRPSVSQPSVPVLRSRRRPPAASRARGNILFFFVVEEATRSSE